MSDSESESEKEKSRRTRKSVVVKFQFEDSSSDDSDVAGPSTGKSSAKRQKKSVLNTSDESSSDSDSPLNLMQRKSGKKTKAQNYVDDSDDSSDDSWSPVKKQQASSASSAAATKPNQMQPTNLSDSSDTDSSCDSVEKCPICLHGFRDQEIGTPCVCDHSFCAPCIEEWSSNVQTCPIDRKPFTSIRIRSRYTDGVFVREQAVKPKTDQPKDDEPDFTHCEICNRSDREDIMLLCDGCDAGYHMDCLMPALTEVPEGSWYCDNCFASDASEDDITQVLAEMETFAAPESRLRVRRENVPRITRTRQSERIRTTIRNRRQENQVNVASIWDNSLPGPSRSTQTITTTTTTVTSTTTTRRKTGTKKKVQKRRRKVHRRRRTYVVEYDVDEYNHKFGIKTANRVIRRRRKTKKSRKRTARCGRRNQGQNAENLADGIVSGTSNKGLRTAYPKLHLFGNKNDLEYFSGDSDNDEGIGSLNNSIDAGDGLLVMSRPRVGGHMNLMRRKNVAINSTMGNDSAGGIDILSNIMDTMNRWHTMSQPSTIEKIKINADGSLEGNPQSTRAPQNSRQPNADILNAPLNARNDDANNRNFNNANGYRGNDTSNQNSGNFQQNRLADRNEQTSIQPHQRAGNFNESGSGSTNLPAGNQSPRNRTPFQRQRSSSRLLRNQIQVQQPPPQGLYDGEDIPPIPSMSAQTDDDVNSRLKDVQQDSDGIVQANPNSPSEQPQSEQNLDCGSTDIQTAVPQEQSDAQITGEKSSSHEQPVAGAASNPVNYSDSDETGDDCPVFEYSAESMKVAKESKDSADSETEVVQPNDETMENDEDLVQLDDDEHFANETGISEEHINQSQAELNRSIESPVASPESSSNSGSESPDIPAAANETNEPNAEKLTDDVSESEDHLGENSQAQSSSHTPEKTKKSNDKIENTGIEGMDTEMISEDEHELHDEVTKDLKADKENNNKSDRDDSFKKVSKNNKDRNYRDKKDKENRSRSKRSKSRVSFSRSKTRSRSSKSRSRSRNRNRRGDKRPRRKDNREKRQELQRYDVRTVIADRLPKPSKDKYGRDTSRPPRSVSPRRAKSRSMSRSVSAGFPSRRRSLSRHRSPSRRRRSPSRRSNSPRRRRSLSRNRRRRSISRSPVFYASSRSRSMSRGRAINGQSRSRSRSRSFSPSHSAHHLNNAFSRSRSRDKKSKKKSNDKKNSKYRSKKKASGSKRVSPFHSPGHRAFSPADRRRRSSRSKSWNDRENSWNRSVSDVPNEAESSWTPPIAHAPENLTVILKNKDSKRNKRDKKRKSDKRKTDSMQRKEKRKRSEKQGSPSLPSKEVFASGDNILVSVSFNKDKPQQQQQTTIVTLPPTKEQILSKKTADREASSRRSRRGVRDTPRKHRKVDIKPVAIIDLDNSPFKEVTPSPRAVIILSDSDHENDKLKGQSLNYSSNTTESISNDKHHSSIDNRESNIRVSSPPLSPTAESASFELPLGPKTPPEPSHLVKFSLGSTKTKIVRTVVNPLHDDNDDDEEEDGNGESKESKGDSTNATADKVQNSNAQSQQKVGPNTPPGPCSPDVYDPFEPTKSASQSPIDSIHDNTDEPAASEDGVASKSVDLSMALINSKASMDAANSLLSSTLGGEDLGADIPNDESNVSPYKDKADDNFRDNTVSKSSGIHVFSNVLLTPAKNSNQPSQSRSSTLTIANLASTVSSISKQSPMKYNASSIISKLPLPKIAKPQRHNGNDDNMDIESPYSPGSSDYDDWFEPPQNSPPTASHSANKHSTRPSKSNAANTSTGKIEVFDDLFGSTSPINKKAAGKRKPSKHSSSIKVSKHSTQNRLNEEQLRILDDVPSSAVELQVKDKFLKKLNRQERVIEEVKLVLKPHYNKKHITKDEYKDIMRRAVPKICHNRTGEINPKKIKKLIEAYVGKFRQKRKLQQSTNVTIK